MGPAPTGNPNKTREERFRLTNMTESRPCRKLSPPRSAEFPQKVEPSMRILEFPSPNIAPLKLPTAKGMHQRYWCFNIRESSFRRNVCIPACTQGQRNMCVLQRMRSVRDQKSIIEFPYQIVYVSPPRPPEAMFVENVQSETETKAPPVADTAAPLEFVTDLERPKR